MKVSFLGQKYSVYKIENGVNKLYTINDNKGSTKKVVKHTLEPDGSKKREILSPNGDTVELTTYRDIKDKKVITTFDSKGYLKSTSIIEDGENEKNYLITDFVDYGTHVSRMLSIEQNPNITEISEILYDPSGKIAETNYRMLSKKS